MLPAVSVDPRRAPPAPAVTVARPGRHRHPPRPSPGAAGTVDAAGRHGHPGRSLGRCRR